MYDYLRLDSISSNKQLSKSSGLGDRLCNIISSLVTYLPLIYIKNLILSSSIPSFRDKSLLLYNTQLTHKPRYNIHFSYNINLQKVKRVGLSVALFLTALHSRHVSDLVCLLLKPACLACAALRMIRNTDSLSAFLCLSLPPIQRLYDEPSLFPLLQVAQI